MRARTFWKAVVDDRTDFLDRLLSPFTEHCIRYCLIDGQRVNAYAEPVTSLDLDLVVVELCPGQPITRFQQSRHTLERGHGTTLEYAECIPSLASSENARTGHSDAHVHLPSGIMLLRGRSI